jgi:putative transposase
MDQHRAEFRVVLMVRVLGVSRSGYYAWRNRIGVSVRQQARKQLDALVVKAFVARKARYGSPRLVLDLCDAGHECDRKTGASSLRR